MRPEEWYDQGQYVICTVNFTWMDDLSVGKIPSQKFNSWQGITLSGLLCYVHEDISCFEKNVDPDQLASGKLLFLTLPLCFCCHKIIVKPMMMVDHCRYMTHGGPGQPSLWLNMVISE